MIGMQIIQAGRNRSFRKLFFYLFRKAGFFQIAFQVGIGINNGIFAPLLRP